MNQLSTTRRAQIVRCLVEGNSIRATAEQDEPAPAQEQPTAPDIDPKAAAAALGRRGGLKGGPARAAKLTAEERRESARRAAAARWHADPRSS